MNSQGNTSTDSQPLERRIAQIEIRAKARQYRLKCVTKAY